MRLFEGARFAAFQAVGLIDAEQFCFHPVRRNRGRVNDHERTIRASRQLMERARGEFLARSRGADDQHAAICRRHAFDCLSQLGNRRRMANQRPLHWRQLFELLDLAFKA
jgi:hypothetical protein